MVEDGDRIGEIQPQIDVSAEAIYIKAKKKSSKTPSGGGVSGGQLSRTQKLYLGSS